MASAQDQHPESFEDMQQHAMKSLAHAHLSTQPTNKLSRAQIHGAGRPISCLRTPVNSFRVSHKLHVTRNAAILERSEVQRPSSEGLDRYEASSAPWDMA